MSDRATNCLVCLELSFLGCVTYSAKTGTVLGKPGSWTNMYLYLHFPDNSDFLMFIRVSCACLGAISYFSASPAKIML